MARAILVTGAAGFAGSHLLDLLTGSPAAPDPPIVGWYRPGSTLPARNSAVKWEAVDLLDRSSVVDAVARLRPALVYHCAGAAHVGQAWERTEATFAINVRGTHHLVEGLSRAGAEARVLVPGSALVYRPAKDGYFLYSVGVNGVDDGGRGYGDDPPADDLAVRMPLPAK